MSDRAAAVETLRRCAVALAGELSADERRRVIALHEQAVRMLEEQHRPATVARIERLRRLEQQMARMAPGERASAIRVRMRLSKSGYYKLRQIAVSPRTNVDSEAV